jgi:hypothetical protein
MQDLEATKTSYSIIPRMRAQTVYVVKCSMCCRQFLHENDRLHRIKEKKEKEKQKIDRCSYAQV